MSENLRGKASLPFSLSIVNQAGDEAILAGHTRDMRATGLSLVLPDVHNDIQEIVGEDRTLRIVLELPTGPIEIEAAPVRYEQLNEQGTDRGYLVGARITEISDHDCVRFVKYLRSLR
jgi:hypothetical protein